MSYHYFSDELEADPTKLPNIEIFTAAYGYCSGCGALRMEIAAPTTGYRLACTDHACQLDEVTVELNRIGFFWWLCHPGCLPDSEPMGPFDSVEKALEDARS